MSMRRPLIFQQERTALLALIVEEAFEEATGRGVFLSHNQQEARMILVRRVMSAIEEGETDIDRLKALALMAPMTAQRHQLSNTQ